jgi:hypothetical protein
VCKFKEREKSPLLDPCAERAIGIGSVLEFNITIEMTFDDAITLAGSVS